MNAERREFTRYRVPGDAIFIYSNYSPVRGWLKNISYGGMAFEYTPVNDCEIQPEIRLIIVSDRFSFYLSDLRCKVIHDKKISQNKRAIRETATRRCGVQYEEVDSDMQEKLMFLLSNKLMPPQM